MTIEERQQMRRLEDENEQLRRALRMIVEGGRAALSAIDSGVVRSKEDRPRSA